MVRADPRFETAYWAGWWGSPYRGTSDIARSGWLAGRAALRRYEALRRSKAALSAMLLPAHVKGERWPVNPRGEFYCRAPVPGGCDRYRCRRGCRHGSLHPMCSAHYKRKERGTPIDTPILDTYRRRRSASHPTGTSPGRGEVG